MTLLMQLLVGWIIMYLVLLPSAYRIATGQPHTFAIVGGFIWVATWGSIYFVLVTFGVL